MENIQFTVRKISTDVSGKAKTHTRHKTSKITRRIQTVREVLELGEQIEVTIEDQCKQSWLNHECRNSDLEFRYEKVEGTGISTRGYDWETHTYTLKRVPPRYNVTVSYRDNNTTGSDRPGLVESCANIGAFFK